MMEPTSLIVTALIAAELAVRDQSISDYTEGYRKLRALLRSKIAHDSEARHALLMVLKNPNSIARQALLREELERLKIETDDGLVQAALDLLNELEGERGISSSKYDINISSSSGLVIGDQANVKQTFGGDFVIRGSKESGEEKA